jgi:hypothetical protein
MSGPLTLTHETSQTSEERMKTRVFKTCAITTLTLTPTHAKSFASA